MLFFLCMRYSLENDIVVKPYLDPNNINSFLNQILEIQLKTDQKFNSIEILPNFSNPYRHLFAYTYNDNAAGIKLTFNKNKKSYTMNLFSLKSDWNYDDELIIRFSPNINDNVLETHIFDAAQDYKNNNIFLITFAVLNTFLLAWVIFYGGYNYLDCFIIILIGSLVANLENYRTLNIIITGNSVNINMYSIVEPYIWTSYDEKAFLKALESDLNYSKCKHCNFKPANILEKGSTIRDAIFTFTYNYDQDFTGLKSARTAGFKGKIFIFSDALVPDNIKDCGIYHVPIQVYLHGDFYHYSIRFPLMYQILSKYSKHFDRIIYVDAGDTYFQSDPFNFTDDYLQVSDENIFLYNQPFVNSWSKMLPGFNIEYWRNLGHVYCSGVFGGKVPVFYNISRLVAGFYRKGEYALADQGVYDIILSSNLSKNAGLKFKANPDFHSRAIEFLDKNFDKYWPITPLGKFYDVRSGLYPAILHQVDRKKALHDLFRRQCE